MEAVRKETMPRATRKQDVLQAWRQHLMLPSDDLKDHSKVLLHIEDPKTRRRGGGRHQYGSMEDADATAFLEALYKDSAPDDLLYPLEDRTLHRRFKNGPCRG